MIHLCLEQAIAAPRHRVWKILADHEGMPDWFPAREVIRRRAGARDPNGVGAIRVVRIRGFAVEERITTFEPTDRMEYTVTEGAPFRNHHAEVVLTPTEGGTRVRWSVNLKPLIPGTGWVIEKSMAAMLRQGLAGLRRTAESS